MGTEVRKRFNPVFSYACSSPQPRAIRTIPPFLAGVSGWSREAGLWRGEFPTIHINHDLDDFSSDTRPVVVEALKRAKNWAATYAIETETALFLAPDCAAALELKATEALGAVNVQGKLDGDSLLVMHGAAIEGVCIALQINSETLAGQGMGEIGGQFDKCEGFVAHFMNGHFVRLEQIRQPAWLRSMQFALDAL